MHASLADGLHAVHLLPSPPPQVLLKLHSDVLPAMSSPLLLSDFLTHALDQGGFEGMLALNGLFTLVTRHGLEYPAFYARLYGLITPDAFVNKHRCARGRCGCGCVQGAFECIGCVSCLTALKALHSNCRSAATAIDGVAQLCKGPPKGAL